jgi:AcrR family transcriptional regulator
LSDRTLETGAFKRGPGGRPTREEAERRHRGLIEAAFRLFAEKGWDGTSIDEISRRAGVAKGFIYSRYPDKAALFFAAIEWVMEDAMGTLQMSEPLPAPTEEGLYTFGKRLLDLVLRPDALAFFRLFIAEAPKFPGLGEHFVTRNKLLGLVAGVLSQFGPGAGHAGGGPHPRRAFRDSRRRNSAHPRAPRRPRAAGSRGAAPARGDPAFSRRLPRPFAGRCLTRQQAFGRLHRFAAVAAPCYAPGHGHEPSSQGLLRAAHIAASRPCL